MNRFHFYVYKKSKTGDNLPIKYGDEVGFMYSAKNNNHWLSCDNDYKCTTRTCPGKSKSSFQSSTGCYNEYFRMYAPSRAGSCSTDVRKDCNDGKPIENGDTVFFKINNSQGSTVHWMRAEGHRDSGKIWGGTCPGSTIDSGDENKCKKDDYVWKIFFKQ